MNFYKLKIENNVEIINLNLIRSVNYLENDEIIYANDRIPFQITYIDGSYSNYLISYSELCRFECALHPSFS